VVIFVNILQSHKGVDHMLIRATYLNRWAKRGADPSMLDMFDTESYSIWVVNLTWGIFDVQSVNIFLWSDIVSL
jgi:hypothetical protein